MQLNPGRAVDRSHTCAIYELVIRWRHVRLCNDINADGRVGDKIQKALNCVILEVPNRKIGSWDTAVLEFARVHRRRSGSDWVINGVIAVMPAPLRDIWRWREWERLRRI